jgi:hypothetical protein
VIDVSTRIEICRSTQLVQLGANHGLVGAVDDVITIDVGIEWRDGLRKRDTDEHHAEESRKQEPPAH